MVSDSMIPTSLDNTETQLPCSPSELANTDVALSTLKSQDEHDASVAEQVHPLFYMFFSDETDVYNAMLGHMVCERSQLEMNLVFLSLSFEIYRKCKGHMFMMIPTWAKLTPPPSR